MPGRGAVVTMGTFDGVHRGHQAVLAEAFYDSMTRDLRDVAAIRAPVLCVVTTENVPPEMREVQQASYRAQLSALAQQELLVVPGAHHYVMFDEPALFFSTLDRFLAATK